MAQFSRNFGVKISKVAIAQSVNTHHKTKSRARTPGKRADVFLPAKLYHRIYNKGVACIVIVDTDNRSIDMSRVLSTLTRHGRRSHRHLSRSPQHIAPQSFYFDDNDDDENSMHQHNNSNSIAPPSYLSSPRQYHTTSRKEILPFIAAGVVLGGAVCEYICFSLYKYLVCTIN